MLLRVWRAIEGITREGKAVGAALLLGDGGEGAGGEHATEAGGKGNGF